MDPLDEWLILLSEVRRALRAIVASLEAEAAALDAEADAETDSEDYDHGGEA